MMLLDHLGLRLQVHLSFGALRMSAAGVSPVPPASAPTSPVMPAPLPAPAAPVAPLAPSPTLAPAWSPEQIRAVAAIFLGRTPDDVPLEEAERVLRERGLQPPHP